MKPALSTRVKNFVRRILLSVAPLGSPRHTPQQLELFTRPSSTPSPDMGDKDKTVAPSKRRPRNNTKGGRPLASFI